MKVFELKDLDNSQKDMFNEYLLENSIIFRKNEANRKIVNESLGCDNAIIVIAILDNKILGYVYGRELDYREDCNRIYIEEIIVDGKDEDCYIKNSLLKELEKYSKIRGIVRIYTCVAAKNSFFIDFYKQNNYEVEREQVVKYESGDKNVLGKSINVLHATAEDVIKYKDQFSKMYFENVKVHTYMDRFSLENAKEKIYLLCEYIRKNKADVYYMLNQQDVIAFTWIHPIDYEGENRIYIHAISINEKWRGKGLASVLYSHVFENIYTDKIIYTHYDESNIASKKLHCKYYFNCEVYQFVKNL